MKIGGSLFALHFECLTIDDQRQHIAPRKHRIHTNLFAVETALPSGVDFFKFQPVRFAAHNHVVDHTVQRSASARPFCFQLDETGAWTSRISIL